MDFAPYQDESPEIERAMSPENRSPLRTPPLLQTNSGGFGNTGFGGRDVEGGRTSLGVFETSLPIRMDIEALLAYVPLIALVLLIMEHKSDYVR